MRHGWRGRAVKETVRFVAFEAAYRAMNSQKERCLKLKIELLSPKFVIMSARLDSLSCGVV
jgi:hypothetical protein